MKRAYTWIVGLIDGIINKIKERRDRKFLERIDRVYFRIDENGVRHPEGDFQIEGNLWTTGFLSAKLSIPKEGYKALIADNKEKDL